MTHRLGLKIALLVVLGVAVHLILPQLSSLEHSWQVLRTLAPWAVGLAVFAQVLSYLGSGYLLQAILKLSNRSIKLFRSTMIVLGSASIGMLAGGILGSAGAIYRWTSSEDSHPEIATLASVLPPMLNNLILVIVSIFGMVHLILVHDLSRSQEAGFITTILILGSIIGLMLLALRYRESTLSVVTWIARRIARLRKKPFDPGISRTYTTNLFSSWDMLRSGAWQASILGAVLNVIFDMLTLYLLFAAAGHAISPGILLAGYGLPLLLGRVAFVVPGGVGVVEGSMVALYNGLGVPNSTSVVVVLCYRFLSFWLPSLSGFPVAAILQRNRSKPVLLRQG